MIKIMPAPTTTWKETFIKCQTCDRNLIVDTHNIWTCSTKVCPNYLVMMTNKGVPSDNGGYDYIPANG